MFTIDRINRLRRHYGLQPIDAEALWTVPYSNGCQIHTTTAILDDLDEEAGIETNGHPVGKRLTLHEEELEWKVRPRFYHWLGNNAVA